MAKCNIIRILVSRFLGSEGSEVVSSGSSLSHTCAFVISATLYLAFRYAPHLAAPKRSFAYHTA
jgi:hypothetical protein